jgi:hypothetical protein
VGEGFSLAPRLSDNPALERGTFSVVDAQSPIMSDPTVQCWLVERTFDDRNLVTIVYATPDGERYQQRERSTTALQTGSPVTAASEIPESELEAVSDEQTRERYAAEAERTAEQYEPDEAI